MILDWLSIGIGSVILLIFVMIGLVALFAALKGLLALSRLPEDSPQNYRYLVASFLLTITSLVGFLLAFGFVVLLARF